MKKVLFTLNINHSMDLVTNSSSELFVLKGKTKEIVEELLVSIYPDYLTEYYPVKHIDDLTVDELDTFFSYLCSPHMWPADKSSYPIPNGFTFEELYEPEVDWKTGEVKPPAWNGEIQYRLKNNVVNPESFFDRSFITEKNILDIKNKLDPEKNMYFLYSINENPDWDRQEELMLVADRYHLG